MKLKDFESRYQGDIKNAFNKFQVYIKGVYDDPKTKSSLPKDVETWVNDFEKFYNWGAPIDGKNAFYTPRGVYVSYIGMKNIIFKTHPNARIQTDIVYDGDEFEYENTNEGIKYSYRPKNAFSKKDILGAFCYIKLNDDSGTEVLETLSKEELDQLQKLSKVQNIWKSWPTEMMTKSVIRRATKRLRDDERLSSFWEYDDEHFGANLEDEHEISDEESQEMVSNVIIEEESK